MLLMPTSLNSYLVFSNFFATSVHIKLGLPQAEQLSMLLILKISSFSRDPFKDDREKDRAPVRKRDKKEKIPEQWDSNPRPFSLQRSMPALNRFATTTA